MTKTLADTIVDSRLEPSDLLSLRWAIEDRIRATSLILFMNSIIIDSILIIFCFLKNDRLQIRIRIEPRKRLMNCLDLDIDSR